VSKAKILGANYGAMAVLPFANASIEAPAFQLGQTIDTGAADMLVRPIDLGWHSKRADVVALRTGAAAATVRGAVIGRAATYTGRAPSLT